MTDKQNKQPRIFKCPECGKEYPHNHYARKFPVKVNTIKAVIELIGGKNENQS